MGLFDSISGLLNGSGLDAMNEKLTQAVDQIESTVNGVSESADKGLAAVENVVPGEKNN